MSTLTSLIAFPFLVVLSIPLFVLASFTTTIAFWTLFVRVLIVYLELGVAILRDYVSQAPSFVHWTAARTRPAVLRNPTSPRRKSPRSHSSGSVTPKHVQSPVYSAVTLAARDYEGVGGWRFPASDDPSLEDDPWTNMNSRLELPAADNMILGEHQRWHHRSHTVEPSTSGKGAVHTGRLVGTRTRPASALVSGTVSPEESFRSDGRVRSMISLGDAGMNVGRARVTKLSIRDKARRKSSSGSTGSSTQTVQAAM